MGNEQKTTRSLTLEELIKVKQDGCLWIECKTCGNRIPIYPNTNLKKLRQARCLKCDSRTSYTLKIKAVLTEIEGMNREEWRDAYIKQRSA